MKYPLSRKVSKLTLVSILIIICLLQLAFQPSISQTQGQTQIDDYAQARGLFWREMYARGGDETLYCGRRLTEGYNAGVNIEHVFPMYWATRALNCGSRKQCRASSQAFNWIEADLHNMYPSLTEINAARGSLEFGIILAEKRQFGSCDFEIDNADRVVEPRDAVLGEIARANLYMVSTYDALYFTDQQLALMKAWHAMDPPSRHEQWRNDQIEKIQGNRNPLIDQPALVEDIEAYQ